jgi:hypothetical protein
MVLVDSGMAVERNEELQATSGPRRAPEVPTGCEW